MNKKPHVEGEGVLISGGSGFIGSYVIDSLKDQFDFTVIDTVKPKQDVKFCNIDLKNPFSISKNFHTCIHLAAFVGGIQYFTKHPVENIRDNPRMTANIFDACVESEVNHVIYTSSSVVYQHQTKFPTKEDDVENSPPPSSAYGLSKLIGEHFCKAYNEQYGLSYTVIRPFNAYGPGEFPDMDYAHVIPQLIKKVLSNQYPIEIYGSGQQSRTFTYGTDIGQAFRICIENPNAKNEVFNVSGDEEIKIIDVLNMIWKEIKNNELKVRHLPPFPHDVMRRYPSNQKIKQKLNWEPKVRFHEGLKKTIEWLKELPKNNP